MSTRDAASDGPAVHELLFVGLNGRAAAVRRDTGEIVWVNNSLRSGYVTLLLEGERLFVSTNGHLFCLDPSTGAVLWSNNMRAMGWAGGPMAMVTAGAPGSGPQSAASQAAQMTTAAVAAATAGS